MVHFSRAHYDISYKDPFWEAFDQLPFRVQQLLGEAIDTLETNPKPHGAEPHPKLRDFYIWHIGTCVILYEINEDNHEIIQWQLRDQVILAEQYDRDHPTEQRSQGVLSSLFRIFSFLFRRGKG